MNDARAARFDLFVSYAHRDNEGAHDGRVTALVAWIAEQYRQITSQPLSVFFDRDAIRSMDDWEERILIGLRQSRTMVAVLSPSYFASAYCRQEWQAYLDQELAHA